MYCDVTSLWPSVIGDSGEAHVLCPSARGASVLRDFESYAHLFFIIFRSNYCKSKCRYSANGLVVYHVLPATTEGQGQKHREVSCGLMELEHVSDIVYFLVPIP